MMPAIFSSSRLLKHAALIAAMMLCLLLLASCGSASSSGGSAPAATPTTAPASTPDNSGSGYSYGGGKYGNNNNSAAPTATTAAVKGPTKAVSITSLSGEFGFNPASLTIPVGTTVIWTNNSGAPHTVTSDDGKTFDSGMNNPLTSGKTFSFTFTKAGTYAYHCQIHPSMTATIIVK